MTWNRTSSGFRRYDLTGPVGGTDDGDVGFEYQVCALTSLHGNDVRDVLATT